MRKSCQTRAWSTPQLHRVTQAAIFDTQNSIHAKVSSATKLKRAKNLENFLFKELDL